MLSRWFSLRLDHKISYITISASYWGWIQTINLAGYSVAQAQACSGVGVPKFS